MGLILIFNRKVIPLQNSNPKEQLARVECGIVGFLDGEEFDVGEVKFPTKQSWTKFWGTVQRGALAVPEIEVKMQNVPYEEPVPAKLLEEPDPTKPIPVTKWVGNTPPASK